MTTMDDHEKEGEEEDTEHGPQQEESVISG